MSDASQGGPQWVERRAGERWSWTWKKPARARLIGLLFALGAAAWMAPVVHEAREMLHQRAIEGMHEKHLEPCNPRKDRVLFEYFPAPLMPPTFFALVIGYVGLCAAFNRVEVRLDHERLLSIEGPIPARRRVREMTANISAFQLRPVSLINGQQRWAAVVITFDGRSVEIAERIDVERSRWLVERLNRALETLRAPHTYRG